MNTVTDPPAVITPELYFSAVEVAAYLGVTTRWVSEKARQGVLPSHRLPGSNRVRFLLSEVEAAMQTQWEAV